MVTRETRIVVRQAKGKMKHQGSSAADMKRLRERREQAWKLRMAGATMMDIVNAGIGYNNTAMVSQDLKKARETFYQEDIESLLILDLARIDEMQKLCTIALRMGNTSEVRNIMALMQFRRETMGITPEAITDRRNTSSITNNGIMVVQGSTRDYLHGVMSAAGASEEDIAREFKELESAGHKGSGDTGTDDTGTSETSTSRKSGSPEVIKGEVIKKRLKVVRKNKSPELNSPEQHERAQPGTGSTVSPGTPAARADQPFLAALGDSVLLGELVEARAHQIEQQIGEMYEPGMGKLSDPAVVPVELAVLDVEAVSGVEREFPVKLRDSNVPVSSGVSYKTPPRKPTQEEGMKEVTRKLKRPAQVDRVRTRVHEEQI